MANAHLAVTLAQFKATLHQTKNRLVSIPAEVQRKVGLVRQQDNDLLQISIRKHGSGRWNHHIVRLTFDNEFAIPSDVTDLAPGHEVEVKIHEVYAGTPRPPRAAETLSGAALLVDLASRDRPGFRTDGSTRLDEYLHEEARGSNRLR
jgi:hypothetical protein